jgi:phytoene synthase
MTPDEYCQEKTARSGTSFYYSFLFLPPERRRAITALYAFCREVDDVVDEVTDRSLPAPSSRGGARDRRDVHGNAAASGCAGAAPGGRRVPAARRALPDRDRRHGDGSRAHSLSRFCELERYCHCVAGVVGLMSAEIFGYVNPATGNTRATSASRSS